MADPNFVIGLWLTFIMGALAFSVVTLIPTMLQGAMHMPAIDAGWAVAPRGVGVMLTMVLASKLTGRVSDIFMIAAGFLMNAISMFMLSFFSPDADTTLIAVTGFVQGLGLGLIFLSVTTITFANVPGHLREEAASISMLLRNLGAAVGISAMQALLVRNAQSAHAYLSEGVSIDNPLVRGMNGFDIGSLQGMMALDSEIYRQALFISYLGDFRLATILSLLALPLLVFVRQPKTPVRGGHNVIME